MDIAVFRFEKTMLKLPLSRPKGAAWLNNSRENHKLNNRQLLAIPLDRHLHILGIDCTAVREILQRVGGLGARRSQPRLTSLQHQNHSS